MHIKFRLTFLLFSSLFISNAQDNYLDIIANKSCECIKEKKEKSPKITTTDLGVCLLVSVKDYKSEILTNHNIDISNLDGKNGERLGELIGLQMAFVCPELLAEFADEDEAIDNFEFLGKVVTISSDSVVIFELKNDLGKLKKFYWLTFIRTEYNLQNAYKKLKNENVQIAYIEQELFDPRIKEYRKFNVITSLKIIK